MPLQIRKLNDVLPAEKIPSEVHKLLGKELFLAGGALRSIIEMAPVKDWDIYGTEKGLAKVLAMNLPPIANELSHEGQVSLLLKKGIVLDMCNWRPCKTPIAVIATFDIVANQLVTDGTWIYFQFAALKDIANKIIEINNINNIGSIKARVRKLQSKGYRLSTNSKTLLDYYDQGIFHKHEDDVEMEISICPSK